MLLDVWLYNGKFLPLGTEQTGVSMSRLHAILTWYKDKERKQRFRQQSRGLEKEDWAGNSGRQRQRKRAGHVDQGGALGPHRRSQAPAKVDDGSGKPAPLHIPGPPSPGRRHEHTFLTHSLAVSHPLEQEPGLGTVCPCFCLMLYSQS